MNPDALANVAVLIGVPVSRTDFAERVQESDWLGKFRLPDASPEEQRKAEEDRWREYYSPLVAEPVREMAELVRSGGGDVRARATLGDLASVTRTREIVILLGHWKGPEIVLDDLRRTWSGDAFLARAAEAQTPLATWLALQLRRRSSNGDSDTVLDILNEALDVSLPSSREEVGLREHVVTRQARRREELELLFPENLRPGNRLELFDGLHGKELVESSIAADFTGVLDLAICTSTVLADYIGSRRQRRVRIVQLATVVELIWAAKAIAGALHLAGTGNFGYQEARITAAAVLNQVIKENGAR